MKIFNSLSVLVLLGLMNNFELFAMEQPSSHKTEQEEESTAAPLSDREEIIKVTSQALLIGEYIARAILELLGIKNPSIKQTQEYVELVRSPFRGGQPMTSKIADMRKRLLEEFLQRNSTEQDEFSNKMRELAIKNQQTWKQISQLATKYPQYTRILIDAIPTVYANEQSLGNFMAPIFAILPHIKNIREYANYIQRQIVRYQKYKSPTLSDLRTMTKEFNETIIAVLNDVLQKEELAPYAYMITEAYLRELYTIQDLIPKE